MIPGLTPVGTVPVSTLPAGYDLSVADPLATFLRDPRAFKTFLLEGQPYDVVGAALATVRLSNDGYATPATDPTLASVPFRRALERPYNVQVSVMDGGRLRDRGIPAYGDCTLLNPDRTFDAYLGYEWAYRALTIKVGRPSFLYSQFGTIFNGTAEDVGWTPESITIRLRDLGYKLAKPLQPNTYKGTGGAVRCDGVDDHLSATVTSPAGSMTFECLLRLRSSIASQETVGGWFAAGAGQRMLTVGSAATNRVTFFVRNDAGTQFSITADAALTVGRLHAVAAVLDTAASKLRLYIDGVAAAAEVSVSGAWTTTLTSLSYGRRSDGIQYADVDLDELRIWGLRTAGEILSYRDREALGTETGLAHCWHLNDGTGTSAADAVSGGTALTLTGGPTWIGSLEGEASIAGKRKPYIVGQVRQWQPVLVDSVNLVYQVHDGSMQAVGLAQDKGADLTGDGDVADLYAAAAPAAGHYKTDLARGYIRLGSKPDGELTVDAQGDNTGGYVSSCADIVKRIVKNQGGLVDGDLDLGSFAALNTATTAVLGYGADLETVNIDTAVSELASSVGAFWTYTRAGLLRIKRLDAPSAPTATLTAEDVEVGRVTRDTAVRPVSKRYTLNYHKHWTTQQPASVATALSAEAKALLAQEYRAVTGLPTSTTLTTVYLDAADASDNTLIDVQADAQVEADRRQGLYGVKRHVYRVPLVTGLFLYEIGQVVRLELPLYDLDAGKDFVIVGFTEAVLDQGTEEIILTLWG